MRPLRQRIPCGGKGRWRIRTTIEGDTNIGAKSQIVADGASAPKGNTNLTCCGAGAGGTVILRSVSLAGSGPIGASGGDGNVKGTLVRGGGGGWADHPCHREEQLRWENSRFRGFNRGFVCHRAPGGQRYDGIQSSTEATSTSNPTPIVTPAATRAATAPSTTLAIKACFPSIPRCCKSVDRRRAQ